MIPTLQLGQFGRSDVTGDTPQPTFASVMLLLHCNEKPFIDASAAARPVVNIQTILETSTKKFGAGSFTGGTNRGLWCPGSSDWTFGTGTWCMEAWVYRAAGVEVRVFDTRTTASNTGAITLNVDTSNQVFTQIGATVYGTTAPAVTVGDNVWTHIAASYDGTNIRTFVNGQVATTTAASPDVSASNPAFIGNSAFLSEGNTGFIDDVRIVKGEALYTTSFAAPPAAHPDTGTVLAAAPAGTYANVVGLLHFESGLTDNAGTPKTYTAAGGAAVSTAQFKWGAQSLALDGTGDWISTPADAVWDFGTGDFTLEAWVRLTNYTNNNVIWSTYNGATDGWSLYTTQTAGVLRFNRQGTTFDGGLAVGTGAWAHVALCKISGALYLYVNGELRNYVADTTNYNSSTAAFIGQLRAAGDAAFCFTGYIDDARALKAEGVYPRSFLVPTAAFADS